MKRAGIGHDIRASNEGLSSMNPAQKALWFIESHLAGELTLDEIAGVAGISRFHMVRAFAAPTGLSVMRYVRARRLSEAARALAGGAPDILKLALDADYGSHEAFTRAFRDHFGVTPEAVRSLARLDNLRLQEPITMDSTPYRQPSGAAFFDRQTAARRRPRRTLQPRQRRRHSRPVAALPTIRCQQRLGCYFGWYFPHRGRRRVQVPFGKRREWRARTVK